MTLKIATALMAGTMLAGCAATMADDGMQTSQSTTTTRAPVTTTRPATTMTNTMPSNPMVGGVAMMSNMNIVQNASKAPNLSTLVSAVQAADLVATLQGPGPFTVFAPTNDAFDRAPSGFVSGLLQPANKPVLQKVLTYHVVPGRITAADLVSRINAGGGTAMIATVAGENLTFRLGPNGNVMVMGMGGSSAFVTTADVMQSNGVVHVVNGVLAPTIGG